MATNDPTACDCGCYLADHVMILALGDASSKPAQVECRGRNGRCACKGFQNLALGIRAPSAEVIAESAGRAAGTVASGKPLTVVRPPASSAHRRSLLARMAGNIAAGAAWQCNTQEDQERVAASAVATARAILDEIDRADPAVRS